MDASVDPISMQKNPYPFTRQFLPRLFVSLIRNPLEALPPAIFTEPAVFTKAAGGLKVYLSDPALIHEALVKHADVMDKGENVRRALGPALGQGLLTANGAHWKWQRQSVAAAFRHDKLLDLQPAMIAMAQQTRDRLIESRTKTLDIGHEMMRTTFDIIVETMMSGGHGIDVVRVEQAITDYLKTSGWTIALSVVGAPDWLPYPGREKARVATAFLRKSLMTVITERRRNPIERNDLVAMLLSAADPETGRQMSDDEIIDNLMTFITAGHETTALGLAWTLHLLARHPECERRVVEEIREVAGEAPLLTEHVAKLTYTRQVFSEAMRLYPPAPIISRQAIADFQLGPYLIPKDAMLIVPIYAVHHHQAVWPDPERFDPDRFAPDAIKSRHRYAYMPFGAGPRVCIGNSFALMEAVAILAVLLQSFRFGNVGEASPKPIMRVTLRPAERLTMNVERR